jgi:hypothetical protein
MRQVSAQESAGIAAPAAVVYDVVSDYHEGHPAMLPPGYFTHLQVEEGGRGAGTVIRFGMKLGGRVREATATVHEPEPGRVLVEQITEPRPMTTTFTVEPAAEGGCRVTIHTTWPAAGAVGLVEGLLVPPMLRRVFREQLARLGEVAQRRAATAG